MIENIWQFVSFTFKPVFFFPVNSENKNKLKNHISHYTTNPHLNNTKRQSKQLLPAHSRTVCKIISGLPR